MKKLAVLCLIGCLSLSGCGAGSNNNSSVDNPLTSQPEVVEKTQESTAESVSKEEPQKEESKAPAEESSEAEPQLQEVLGEVTMYADFKDGCPKTFMPSGDWSNGDMFNVTWRKKSCTYVDGLLRLTIDKDSAGGKIPYSGAELRSKDFYSYGRYEVNMKAIKNDGVVSSFFTYTGPSDKKPWDEIDVEILGKDTTKVQFNYYTNGKGNHEKMYDLGFDASEDFHTYAFEWRKDSITWYVDGELAHTAKISIPSHSGRIMMNAWCGTGVDSWLKAFDDSNLPLTAEYAWISYAPFEYK